jgi:hypothetical protein
MKISSPILEARWIEGVKGKKPRWYCGLRTCSHWLAEYWPYVPTRWFDGDLIFNVLLLPEGFTKRDFGGRVVCAKTHRSGHKLEVNHFYRGSVQALAGWRTVDKPQDERYQHAYDLELQKLKTEKAPAGRLVICNNPAMSWQHHIVTLPALVKCSQCQRISIIRKICDGQTAHALRLKEKELEREGWTITEA